MNQGNTQIADPMVVFTTLISMDNSRPNFLGSLREAMKKINLIRVHKSITIGIINT